MDERLKKLANIIVNYSINVQKNEKVLITSETDDIKEFLNYLSDLIYEKEAIPYIKINNPIIINNLNKNNNKKSIELITKINEFEVNNFDSFIRIIYNINDYEGKKISKDKISQLGNSLRKSNDIRINKRKWVLLEYPSVLDSFKAKMSINDYYNYAINTMIINYQDMNKIIKPLKKLMDKTNIVKIIGPNTNISFSIKGMNSIPCCGESNLPDGEIYTAPIKYSVNGKITYNTPCPYQGNIYHNVCLEFKDGKIINATCNEDNESLNKIFDIDEGARYIGEFSLGLNPMILNPIGDILYDEKIIGSIHFTPGQAYKNCYNKNDSSIHWDMVLIQRKEYGGGEIYFDDKLIRKDGIFLLEDLKPLNYNLK